MRERLASAEQAERPEQGLEAKWERLLEERVRTTGTFYQSESPSIEEPGFDWGSTPSRKKENLVRSPIAVGGFGFSNNEINGEKDNLREDVGRSTAAVRSMFIGRHASETTVPTRVSNNAGDQSQNSSTISLELMVPRRKGTPVAAKKGILDLVNVGGSRRGKERERERELPRKDSKGKGKERR